MDDEYDAVVLGTGLKECILSGLLSVNGYKVLHMDRNDYYGGESASLNLEQFFKHFGQQTPPESLGRSRDYNIDLIPKFIMASGLLVDILVHTDVTRHLEFKSVDGAYVLHQNQIHKVPSTSAEALSSNLMGIFEKRRFKNLLEHIANYKQEDPKTQKGMDATKVPMIKFYEEFGIKPDTIDFVGHAMALYRNDDYIRQPAKATFDRINMYCYSMLRFGKSPFIYPLYGLGELPQAFARLAAIYGGTYMLNKPVEKIVYDENGVVTGVQAEGEVAKCKMVIGDPSYFQDKVKKTGQIIRCYCILNHPVANTADAESCQIILPQRQIGRKFDIYISVVSFAHNVAAKGKWIAIVSTTVETNKPEEELKPAFALLGKIEQRMFSVVDTFSPTDDGAVSKTFITTSYDATSHFETATEDVVDLFKRLTGKEFDPKAPPRKAHILGDGDEAEALAEQEALDKAQ